MTTSVSGNFWWGDPWPAADFRAPVCEDDRFRIAVPFGGTCMHCGEPIGPKDRGVTYPGYIGIKGLVKERLHAHIECMQRSVLGCSASRRGEPHDHSGSYRADALKVWAEFSGRPLGSRQVILHYDRTPYRTTGRHGSKVQQKNARLQRQWRLAKQRARDW